MGDDYDDEDEFIEDVKSQAKDTVDNSSKKDLKQYYDNLVKVGLINESSKLNENKKVFDTEPDFQRGWQKIIDKNYKSLEFDNATEYYLYKYVDENSPKKGEKFEIESPKNIHVQKYIDEEESNPNKFEVVDIPTKGVMKIDMASDITKNFSKGRDHYIYIKGEGIFVINKDPNDKTKVIEYDDIPDRYKKYVE